MAMRPFRRGTEVQIDLAVRLQTPPPALCRRSALFDHYQRRRSPNFATLRLPPARPAGPGGRQAKGSVGRLQVRVQWPRHRSHCRRRPVDLVAAKRRNSVAWGVSPRTEYGNGLVAAKRRHHAWPQGVAASRLGRGFRIHSRGLTPPAISCRHSAATKSTGRRGSGGVFSLSRNGCCPTRHKPPGRTPAYAAKARQRA